MSISIVLCYARSGGTLLNKWLLNLDDVIVLSEVNPVAEKSGKIDQTVRWQAKEWYGIEVESSDYVDQLLEVYAWCQKNDKHLIIREWPYIDFVPCDLNGFQPSGCFSIIEMLKDKVELNIIAFVRNAIDVYLSAYAISKVDINGMLEPYSKYVDALIIRRCKYFKYEDFCESPDKIGKEICQRLGIPHVSFQTLRIYNITGDIQFSRGNASSNITILKRRYISVVHRKKNKHESFYDYGQ